MSFQTHLDRAQALVGTAEVAGHLSNPEIDAMFRDVGHPQYRDDTAWCAAFVGAMLERSGIKSTRKLTARSYQNWGTPVSVERIQPGDIIVTPRGREAWMGHVEIAEEAPDRGRVLCIGGNESDAVRRGYTDLDKIIAARRPPRAQQVPRRAQELQASSEDRLQVALERLKVLEGGYVDHPADRGGATKYGITIGTLGDHLGRRASKAEVRALTWEQAKTIYRQNYWQAVRADELPVGIDYIVFDMAVNHGPGRAVTILQEALGVTPDGIFGPQTLRAVRQLDEVEEIRREIQSIAQARNAFYDRIINRDPSQRVFERGWDNRSDRVLREAMGDVQRGLQRVAATSKTYPKTTATVAGVTVFAAIGSALIGLGCDWPWLADLLSLDCGE